jgi:hypothetical protein
MYLYPILLKINDVNEKYNKARSAPDVTKIDQVLIAKSDDLKAQYFHALRSKEDCAVSWV